MKMNGLRFSHFHGNTFKFKIQIILKLVFKISDKDNQKKEIENLAMEFERN